jgi:hypothetical protein
MNNIQTQYTILLFSNHRELYFFCTYLSLQLKVQFENRLKHSKINVMCVTDGFCIFQFLDFSGRRDT